jgi:dolichyl-phosphate beta-glucosyltransferase
MTIHAPPSLSIIIPAFNEAKRIQRSLSEIRLFCDRAHPSYEVIVVDDGSVDDTKEKVEEMARNWGNLRCLQYPKNQGKGYAVRTGVLGSRGDWIFCADADLAVPIEQLDAFLLAGKTNPVVIASRFMPDAQASHPTPFHRKAMSRIFHAYASLILGRRFSDTQCGFKLYRRKEAMDIFNLLTIRRFAFDLEVLYLAQKLGYGVTEIPVSLRDSTHSTVHVFTDSLRMALDVLKIRFRRGRWHSRSQD